MAVNESPEMSSMNPSKNQFSQLFSHVGDTCLLDTMQQPKNDLVTILTVKIRMVNQLMTELGLPLSYISQLQSTSTPIHPDVALAILRSVNKQDQSDTLLAQDFVLNEKLLKLIKTMCKYGHTNIAHGLLAMDGLGGKLRHAPNTESKKYVDNLKYSLSGEPGRYDREANDDIKRAHVFAVRKVYQELDKHRPAPSTKLVDGVYQVMRLVLKEFGGIELPEVEVNVWSDNVLADGVKTYRNYMSEEKFNQFLELFKMKITNQANTSVVAVSDEDEGGNSSKRQKVMEKTKNN